jgi:CO/xanthine dehydrogenase Mo-binding subunit
MTMNRRDFLKAGSGWVVSFSLVGVNGLAIAADVPANATAAAVPPLAGPFPSRAGSHVEGFIALLPNGRVEVFSGKVDLGTGVKTALSQMVAEELDVPVSKIDLIQGDTFLTPDQGPTYGSLSIQNGGAQLRQAAATLKAALAKEAAQQFNVKASELKWSEGQVQSPDGRKVFYQELMGDQALQFPLDPKAPLKDPAKHTVVGTSLKRPEIAEIVTGKHTFIHDFRIDGMVHARVIHPAAVKAELKNVDDAACRAIPGYLKTVREGNFLAVVASNEWAAVRAAQAIQAEWTEWAGLPDQAHLWEHVRNSKVASRESFQKDGDVAAAMNGAGLRTLKRSYDFAMHTHGSIGPSCAVAEWKDGAVTVWNASQQTHLLRKQLAKMLNLREDQVRCIYLPGAGCYGRNGHEDAAADAALIARAVGKPVRVQWMRADEHGWDPKGPPTLIDYEAALGPDGRIHAWHSLAFHPHRPKVVAVPLTTALHANLPHEEASPGNIHQSLAVQYTIPNRLCEVNWLEDTPLRPSWIRTPGRMQNTFGNESMMDELAVMAGEDPIAFRCKHLQDPRGDDVLAQLITFAKWTPKVSGSTAPSARSFSGVAKGRGVSYVKYELVRTYVGLVVDVSVDLNTGVIKVDHMYVAHDCGQIINPDGLRNQIDGNMIQTVSRTLIEELKFDRSKVTSVDWVSYPILRYPDVPTISTHLINRPNEKPWGAGEPSAAVVPSAIANAVFDAAGIRLTSVPFTPNKVLAALKAMQA